MTHPTQSSELKEKLAAIEHERWADWQRWMHDQCLKINGQVGEEGYGLVIPNDLVARWERQIKTPYSELSEKEKASDTEQVDRYWPLVESYATKKALEARIDELESLPLDNRGSAGFWISMSLEEHDRRVADLRKQLEGMK